MTASGNILKFDIVVPNKSHNLLSKSIAQRASTYQHRLTAVESPSKKIRPWYITKSSQFEATRHTRQQLQLVRLTHPCLVSS